jgi:carbamoyltransferase
MSQALMKYHPRIGYTYMPDAKLRVPWGNGGYLVRANAAGFRSEREFVRERKPGTYRALLFGDSQSAGDGVNNVQRYTDLLEKALPDFELYNYSISGTGPDQQFLAYQEHSAVERDLLIIALYVENIRRVNSRFIKSRDASGEAYIRAKPYYLIENDELVLHHVPVPKTAWTEETLPPEFLPHCYLSQAVPVTAVTKHLSGGVQAMLKKVLPEGLRRAVKTAAMRTEKFRPVPEFDSADDQGWLLLRGILEAWIRASRTPVLVVPIPHYFFLSSPRDARGYQARFGELADATQCHLYDPLPDLLKLSAEDRGNLWSDSSGHPSSRGHQILADLLAPVLQGLMRASQGQHAPA